MNNTISKFPNQIDDGYVDQLEALINVENILGTLPQGSEYSTIGDRLNAIDKELKSLLGLANKDYLHNLNLATILSLGENTDGYDIILGEGSVITGIGNIINLKGDTTIDGKLDVLEYIDLNKFPFELNHATNKQYVDNQISAQNNKLENELNNITNKDNNLIQYTIGRSDPFPNPEPNKFLKRNIDNSGWEYKEIELKPIYDKFDALTKLINNVSKNNTAGNDITVNVGDAIKSEDGVLNFDADVVIHKGLSVKGIDLEYNYIDNLLDPIKPKQAVTKQYVDNKLPQTLVLSDILKEDQINYYIENLFNADFLRLEGSESAVIHGIKFPDTYVKFNLINVGENNIILKNDSKESNFGNRFKFNSSEFIIKPNESVCLFWDAVNSFWRIIY